jgi:hypothetical protein
MTTPSVDHLADELCVLLIRLHRLKDAAYGDAWRKRGEVLGIFCNIARKYDRLANAMSETEASAVESLGDTAGDLCVYAGKYVTWLAEVHPDGFDGGSPIVPADVAATLGPEAFERVLRAVARDGAPVPPNGQAAWAAVRAAFDRLERGLVAQAAPTSDQEDLLAASDKVALAWSLCRASLWLLVRVAERDDVYVRSIRLDVERMERGQ